MDCGDNCYTFFIERHIYSISYIEGISYIKRLPLGARLLIGFFVVSIVTLIAASSYIASVRAAAVTWDGGGGDGNWATCTNWSGDACPTPADDVTIDATVTVTLAAATTTNSLTLGDSGGSFTPTLNFSYDAITSGALTIDDGSLTVHTGATVTHSAGTTAVVGTVFIDVQTGDATITGSISGTSKGYQNTSGTGQGTDDGAGGGGGAGHGGTGGRGGDQAAGGVAYGDAKAPTTLGSGGGNADATAGAGGGAIKLSVGGTTTITGSVVANGGNGASVSDNTDGPGGGSGGSVWIATGVLAGTGSVTANGGNGFNTGGSVGDDGGGGGGGHIALTYTTDSSTFTVRSAYGGTGGDNGGDGGAGTVYTKAAAQTNGDLLIDNNDIDTLGDNRYSGFTEIDDQSYTFDTVTLSNYGNLNISATTNITYTTLTWSNQGVVTDNGGTFALVSGAGSLSIPSTAILFGNTARSFTDITVEGTLTHSNNFTSATYRIDYTVSGNVTINGSIALNGRGYQNTAGTGQGTDSTTNGGGGGHGGAGGNSEEGTAGGGTYGTAISPTTIGSGGGDADNIGGRGGGAVELTVSGVTTIAGSVTANGTNGGSTSSNTDGPGGGSGGSIWITTATLAGSGSVTANGGSGNDPGGASGDAGGGGGGGRVALIYSTSSAGLSATTASGASAVGGGQAGSAGTVISSGYPAISSLGPASVVNGSTVGTTPAFTAVTSDIDGGDTVQFQIQIDDSSNFASPVVDYTSALAATGSVSFTVGQAAGSGTYTTGSAGQTLAQTSYYWRMIGTDSQGLSSTTWTTANGGSIAFAVDATAPSGYSVTLNQDPSPALTKLRFPSRLLLLK